MSDSLWPLKLLLLGLLLVAIVVLLGLAWLAAISPLPEWVKFLVYMFLAGFGMFGGTQAHRRYRAGKNPWALDKPERG